MLISARNLLPERHRDRERVRGGGGGKVRKSYKSITSSGRPEAVGTWEVIAVAGTITRTYLTRCDGKDERQKWLQWVFDVSVSNEV